MADGTRPIASSCSLARLSRASASAALRCRWAPEAPLAAAAAPPCPPWGMVVPHAPGLLFEPMMSAALTTPRTEAAMAPDAVEPKRRAEDPETSSSSFVRSFLRSVTRPCRGPLGTFEPAVLRVGVSGRLWRMPRGRRCRFGRAATARALELSGADGATRSEPMASAAAWRAAIRAGDPALANNEVGSFEPPSTAATASVSTRSLTTSGSATAISLSATTSGSTSDS